MNNWRYYALRFADAISRKGLFVKLNDFYKLEYHSDILASVQEDKLINLIHHCFNNVPYYREILGDLKVISRHNTIDFDQFRKIPILTKDIIREQKDNLYSSDYKNRKSYKNTSGGSTGVPVTFIQDQEYKMWVLAGRMYYKELAGKKTGDREIKLWGSERDIFKGNESIKTRLDRWLFNVSALNSFVMSDLNMSDYVRRWNQFKPVIVWTYTSSIFELAKFIKNNKLNIHSPSGIICTAETLTEEVRNYIEEVFKTKVLNQYGSRETGIGGCECKEQQGLHIFPHINYLEILNDNNCILPHGKTGNIHFTTLTNYSMPLIRYQIGDTGCLSEIEKCSCGRSWPLLKTVNGRITDHFKTITGKIVHGEFFTHLFYGKEEIKQFQFIQESFNTIKVIYVGNLNNYEINDISEKINLAMDQKCNIDFVNTDTIQRSDSGKFRYTISKVNNSF